MNNWKFYHRTDIFQQQRPESQYFKFDEENWEGQKALPVLEVIPYTS